MRCLSRACVRVLCRPRPSVLRRCCCCCTVGLGSLTLSSRSSTPLDSDHEPPSPPTRPPVRLPVCPASGHVQASTGNGRRAIWNCARRINRGTTGRRGSPGCPRPQLLPKHGGAVGGCVVVVVVVVASCQ